MKPVEVFELAIWANFKHVLEVVFGWLIIWPRPLKSQADPALTAAVKAMEVFTRLPQVE